MGVERPDALDFATAAVVEIKSYVLSRTIVAKIALITRGPLDVDGRFKQVALVIKTQALNFLVGDVAYNFLHRLVRAGFEVSEIVRICGQEEFEVLALGHDTRRSGGRFGCRIHKSEICFGRTFEREKIGSRFRLGNCFFTRHRSGRIVR